MLTDKDFTVTFFDVNGGDGIWIRFRDESRQFHNILIDGGYGKSYNAAFKMVIDQILGIREVIDLWIITHIDGDHIGAILAFLQDADIKEKDQIVKSYWFNHVNFEMPNLSSSISVNQGIKLRKHLASVGIVAESFIDTTYDVQILHGIRFKILSPIPEKRAKADEDWLLEERSKASARKESDHKKTIAELKDNIFTEDDDVSNGSSISFILNYHNYQCLFLGDSHPSDVISSLKSLGYSAGNRLKVDFIKLAHHGSKANTNDDLLNLVDCENYIISANGISHFHPDKEVLVRILTHDLRNPKTKRRISFVSQNDELKDIFKVDVNAHANHNFIEIYPEEGNNYIQLTYNL
ncbi:MAG: MBL fold metallo-hydrolase [Bacteroidetes bacterium]|nr:MBL fold metallo-hydrolase [Bacteroidota bacterium]